MPDVLTLFHAVEISELLHAAQLRLGEPDGQRGNYRELFGGHGAGWLVDSDVCFNRHHRLEKTPVISGRKRPQAAKEGFGLSDHQVRCKKPTSRPVTQTAAPYRYRRIKGLKKETTARKTGESGFTDGGKGKHLGGLLCKKLIQVSGINNRPAIAEAINIKVNPSKRQHTLVSCIRNIDGFGWLRDRHQHRLDEFGNGGHAAACSCSSGQINRHVFWQSICLVKTPSDSDSTRRTSTGPISLRPVRH